MRWYVAAVVAAALVPLVHAQEFRPSTTAENTVTVVGTASLKRPPEALRLRIELQAKGKSLTEALAKLQEKREAARAQLTTLGATESTVTFGDPKIAATGASRQEMELMVRSRMTGRPTSQPTTAPDKAQPVLVSVLLTAEWPLTGDGEARLAFAHELQAKIKAAKLAGTPDTEGLSPEEQEQLEELQGSRSSNSYGEQPDPTAPLLLYVGRISDAERKQLLTEAFQKARADGAQLAEIAGGMLGPLQNLSGEVTGGDESRYSRYSNPYEYAMVQALAGQESVPNKALATEHGPLTFRARLTASFALLRARGG
jgi:uncharacterized protein YggE